MSSRPPTPPSKAPWDDEDFRFKTSGTPCERVGWGQFSTVWLAVDMQLNRYVSLKITLAIQTKTMSKEVSLYQSHLPAESPFLVALHDRLRLWGPMGNIIAFVFETMGPNLTTFLKIRPEFQIGKPWERRFTKSFAKKALWDTLQALHFLHEHSVIHGDIHPGNILICVEQLQVTPDTEISLKQSEGDAQPLKRRDGKKDLGAPAYLLEPRPLDDYVSYDLGPLVKLADLGGAFTEEDSIVGAKAITLVALRAPETILGERLGKGIDIWAFGCLIFEMIFGRPLFVAILSLGGEDYDETSNDEHLIQLWEVIGPLPKPLPGRWRRADQYLNASGNRLEVKPQEDDYVSGDEDMGSVDGVNEEESDSPLLAYPGQFLSLEDQIKKGRTILTRKSLDRFWSSYGGSSSMIRRNGL
ncbi:CMGC/SRPK protein kinase [Fusarium oxysporum NRRL 32931]|uniref:non-specific serine/threonine protein kinase n=1 Tax=Fusarium oxysporum NRRL 32931 TaxID=660029 RepID=W9HL81_FUSOX|nr:CMGC/SRPK protein kinase [Fusarium oxysporum NRRL 32931]